MFEEWSTEKLIDSIADPQYEDAHSQAAIISEIERRQLAPRNYNPQHPLQNRKIGVQSKASEPRKSISSSTISKLPRISGIMVDGPLAYAYGPAGELVSVFPASHYRKISLTP